jgi:hypothetical protein
MGKPFVPPCRLAAAGVALREGLHSWCHTGAPGWFVCVGCGILGVCRTCFAELGYQLPVTQMTMVCPTHRENCPERGGHHGTT